MKGLEAWVNGQKAGELSEEQLKGMSWDAVCKWLKGKNPEYSVYNKEDAFKKWSVLHNGNTLGWLEFMIDETYSQNGLGGDNSDVELAEKEIAQKYLLQVQPQKAHDF